MTTGFRLIHRHLLLVLTLVAAVSLSADRAPPKKADGVTIPVGKDDPAYPIYKSNAEFVEGNPDAAWELYEKNPSQLPLMVRKLTVPFSLWIMERNVELKQDKRAEKLMKALALWSRDDKDAFPVEQKARLSLAYADLCMQKNNLGAARAWYKRVAADKKLKGTELQFRATLGSVAIARAEKNFDEAFAQLKKLKGFKDQEHQVRIRFARAELRYDRCEYDLAARELDWVLGRKPKYPDAVILRGKVQIQIRKLEDALRIPPGSMPLHEKIYVGDPITVSLFDPSSAVVTEGIEVELRSKLGDRELLVLRPVKDKKGKYQAKLPTKKGAPRLGDKVLQTKVGDEITIAYSKQTLEKNKDLLASDLIYEVVENDAAAQQGPIPGQPDSASSNAVARQEGPPFQGWIMGGIVLGTVCVAVVFVMMRRRAGAASGE